MHHVYAGMLWDLLMYVIIGGVLPGFLTCFVVAVGVLKAVSEEYRKTRRVSFANPCEHTATVARACRTIVPIGILKQRCTA